MKSRRTLALLLLASFTIMPAHAASNPSAPKSIAPAEDVSAPPRGAKPAGSPGDRLLWDHWYTVTVNKTTHYQYYNDRAEIKKGRVIFQNHAWKQEECYLNEEQLGVFSEANPQLTPLFFNFHSTYRATETTIDGNATGGRELVIRIRKGETEPAPKKRSIPSKTFFSAVFPVWLGLNLATFRPGQTYPFQTILEDNLEADFMTVNGQLRVEPADELARKTKTTKLMVHYREIRSYWWVDPNGAPVRIEMPTQGAVVERVTEDAAKRFIKPCK